MGNFYDDWLKTWDETVKTRNQARKVIQEEEIEWVSTPQDPRIGLLAAPESGFATWGTDTTIAEIEPGWHTGKHVHGEEAIYILEGEGCTVISGRRYDWVPHTVLSIPFGAEHQHFNTGKTTARYLSVTAANLEKFVGLLKLEQLSNCGTTEHPIEADISNDGFDLEGRRIRMLPNEARRRMGGEEGPRKELGNKSALDGGDAQQATATSHHSMRIEYMRGSSRSNVTFGFQNHEVEISGILSDAPHSHGGRHAHMEAILYIVQGEGYSIIDDEKVPWKKGTCMHVQGPQTMHQHFNTGNINSHMLRIEGCIRSKFFQKFAQTRFPILWFEGHGYD